MLQNDSHKALSSEIWRTLSFWTWFNSLVKSRRTFLFYRQLTQVVVYGKSYWPPLHISNSFGLKSTVLFDICEILATFTCMSQLWVNTAKLCQVFIEIIGEHFSPKWYDETQWNFIQYCKYQNIDISKEIVYEKKKNLLETYIFIIFYCHLVSAKLFDGPLTIGFVYS